MELGLYTFLKNTAGVSALVSDRIYPALIPQEAALPAIVHQLVASAHDHTMDGPALNNPLLRISAVCDTWAQARACREALKTALNGYSGQWADGTFVQLCKLQRMSGPEYDFETLKYFAELDFEIWHS